MSATIGNVPVCADYCNDWFDAYKDDKTCVKHWLNDFVFDEGFWNQCPPNSSCTTFQKVYSNGKGLCNQIWGDSIFYSEDRDNCTVMAFDNSMPNPNFNFTFPLSGSMSVVKLSSKWSMEQHYWCFWLLLLPSIDKFQASLLTRPGPAKLSSNIVLNN